MAFLLKFGVFLSLIIYLNATDTYTNRWDNVNVDEILESDRLLENYKNCLMDQGPCTAEGQELKRNIPDALKNDCLRCTEKQKENTDKVVDFMIDNKKAWWDELEKKYDPSGIYYRRRLARKKEEKENGRNVKLKSDAINGKREREDSSSAERALLRSPPTYF